MTNHVARLYLLAASVLGLFIAAGFRLLPTLYRFVSSTTTFRTGLASVEIVCDDIAELAAWAHERDTAFSTVAVVAAFLPKAPFLSRRAQILAADRVAKNSVDDQSIVSHPR
jgi:hypothetical protein